MDGDRGGEGREGDGSRLRGKENGHIGRENFNVEKSLSNSRYE